MKNQIIVSISREYGSGGHEIAEMVSKKMGLKLYDKNILKEIAEKNNIAFTELKEFDEKPKNVFLSRSVKGYSNSLEENMAHMEFEYIKEKAEEGESFVIVGRCSEEVLKDYEGLVSVFVKGDMEAKTARIMERLDMNEEDAVDEIKKQDKNRRRYHNQYSGHKLGRFPLLRYVY